MLCEQSTGTGTVQSPVLGHALIWMLVFLIFLLPKVTAGEKSSLYNPGELALVGFPGIFWCLL